MNNCSEIQQHINWELLIASFAILMSLIALAVQRRHNRLTFKPFPVIVSYNYLSTMRVRFWNKGNGPLIIQKLKIENVDSLFALMPDGIRILTFVEFINHFEGRVISSNDSLNLIEFKIRKDENDIPKEDYISAISEIRSILNKKTVKIIYKDTYGRKYTYVSEPLDFGATSDEEYRTLQ